MSDYYHVYSNRDVTPFVLISVYRYWERTEAVAEVSSAVVAGQIAKRGASAFREKNVIG